jgi:hypothetical protein
MHRAQRSFSAVRGLLIAVAIPAYLASCELSSGFLSDSERNSLYKLSLSATDGAALSNGAVILPGTDIAALITRKSGAADLSALDFALTSQDGKRSVALRLVGPSAKNLQASAQASTSPTPSRVVSNLEGRLGGFLVPSDLAPGLYSLSATASGVDGSSLQKISLNVFVGRSSPIINSVSTFPPSVEPGSSVLLSLTVSSRSLAEAVEAASGEKEKAKAEAFDPWIRWSKDGLSFAEGLLSEGLDKVVWSAPRIEGAYSLLVEVFPAAPLAGGGYGFEASVRQELKVMVISAPGGSGNDFADPLAFYSLLRLDGSFDDVGTRPRRSQPQGFGSPALDTYSSGFGYRFGPAAGVLIPGLMPPGVSGRLGAFSAILRLHSDQTEGVLARFASEDGQYAIVLGISDSRPYVETLVAGKVLRSTAASPLPRFPQEPLTLEASFRPEGDKLFVSWHAEGERIEAPPLALPPAPPEGSARLGGEQSLPGVYDGFGLMVDSSSPSYRLASRRKWRGSLIAAESFEDGALPPLSVASGPAKVAQSSLVLEPGGSLTLQPAFALASSILVEADIEGDVASCLLVLSSADHGRILSVNGRGEVRDASGSSLGSLEPLPGRLAFLVDVSEGALHLRGAEGRGPIDAATSAKRFLLSLEREAGTGSAAFDRLLLRSTSSLSSGR